VRRLFGIDAAGLDGVEDEAVLRVGAGALAAEAGEPGVAPGSRGPA
jgi:hypothetical protein